MIHFEKNFGMILINIHVPTDNKDEKEKELFYSTLEDVFNTLVGQVRYILEDFNTKVGIHSLHATPNGNGSKLIYFAVGKGLVIKNTMYPRKDIHK